MFKGLLFDGGLERSDDMGAYEDAGVEIQESGSRKTGHSIVEERVVVVAASTISNTQYDVSNVNENN